MVYASVITLEQQAYGGLDAEVMKADELIRDQITEIRRLPNYFVVVHSHISPAKNMHHPLLDFDNADDVTYELICDRFNSIDCPGHLYRTLHGWHFYGDRIMSLDDVSALSRYLGCCAGQRSLAEQRGYYSLRAGFKNDREPDIYYMGHTSGREHEKALVCKYHDLIDSMLRVVYYKYKLI